MLYKIIKIGGEISKVCNDGCLVGENLLSKPKGLSGSTIRFNKLIMTGKISFISIFTYQ